ncbi:MAG: hypothetical protein PUC32_06875 [Oscillospiraceae bacterium]|nr:hypothetical protein [Oscillospiraceae bacterium]
MKSKYLWLTFGVALFFVVPLRVYQLLFLMDGEGFYTDNGLVSWIVLAILLAASTILIAGALSSKHLPKRFTQTRNIPSGIVSVALGLITVVYSIVEIMGLAAPKDAATTAKLAGGLLYIAIILSFAGVGAGIVWIMNGVSSFTGKNLLRWIPAAGILPPIWMAILLFIQTVQLTGNTIALNNTEQVLDTMTIVFMALFCFNHSKMIAGAQGKKCGKRVYAYGLPMVLFAVNAALPGLLSLLGLVNAGAFSWLFSLVVVMLSLTAVVFLLVLPRGENAYEEELVEVPAEEEPALEKPSAEAPKEEGPKENLFIRMMKAILTAIANLKKKLEDRRKRKIIPWEQGELDEMPTKRMDDRWRLDFYGFDNGDDKPYYPEIYDLDPEEVEKRKARQLAAKQAQAEEENSKKQKYGKKS